MITDRIRALNNKAAKGARTLSQEKMNGIVALAESLIPLIFELRHTTENDRRIAEPIVQALRTSDLCRMLLDTGDLPQYTPQEWLKVLEILAGAEASVSWFVWNNTCRVSGPASLIRRGVHGCSATLVGCLRAPHGPLDKP